MDYKGRLQRIRAALAESRLDALLVTHLPNIRYLCGFTGSAAVLAVNQRQCTLFTDGRYTEQSRREVPEATRHTYSGEFAPVFAKACADLGVTRVGFESAGVTHQTYTKLQASVNLRRRSGMSRCVQLAHRFRMIPLSHGAKRGHEMQLDVAA